MKFTLVVCNEKHGSGIGMGPFFWHVWYYKYGQVLVHVCISSIYILCLSVCLLFISNKRITAEPIKLTIVNATHVCPYILYKEKMLTCLKVEIKVGRAAPLTSSSVNSTIYNGKC